MRKFKIKNRPKRKYVRKSETSLQDSLTRTAWYGFVPFLVIIVGLFATTLITNPALTRGISETHMRFPTESVEVITSSFRHAVQIQPPVIHTAPAVKTATTLLESVLHGIITLTSTIVTGISSALKAGGNILMQLAAIIIKLFFSALYALSFIARTIAITSIQFLVFLGMVILTIFGNIAYIFLAMGKALINIIATIVRTIVASINMIGRSLADAYKAFIRIVSAPFIVLSKIYKQIEPGLLYIGKLLANATNDLLMSIVTIMNLPSKLSK